MSLSGSVASFYKLNPLAFFAGAAIIVAVIYVMTRGVKNTVASAVSAAGNVAAGAVVGAGEVVGIPDTNQTQCDKDLAAGDHWAASFSCPATTFIKSLF